MTASTSNSEIAGAGVRISLRANVAWTVGGNAIYALSQWAMLAAIAKLGNPYMVGQFALGLAVAAPVYMFTNMQLRSIQATDARNDYTFADYFGLRLIASVAGLMVVFAVAAFSSNSRQTVFIVGAIGAAKFFESLSDAIYGFCQKHERMKLIAISLAVKGIGSVAALAVVLRLTGSVFAACCAMACVWLLLFAFLDLRWAASLLRSEPAAARRWLPSWNQGTVGKLCILAIPMGIQTMLASLTVNIPRYVVDHELGTGMLGFYAAMAYFIVAGHTVISAVGNSVQARLSQAWYTSLPSFKRLLRQCSVFAFSVGLLATLIAFVAGKQLLATLYRPEYATHVGVFELLMFSAGFYYVGSILNAAIAAARCFWSYTFFYLSVPVMALVGALCLIPPLGLLGAALATLIYCMGNAAVPAVVVAWAYRDAIRCRPEESCASLSQHNPEPGRGSPEKSLSSL
jgi:O-antigen/teichoic acid export membrane protein